MRKVNKGGWGQINRVEKLPCSQQNWQNHAMLPKKLPCYAGYWKSVFSFRVNNIEMGSLQMYIKLNISWLHAFLWCMRQTSHDQVNSCRVQTHEKNSGDAVHQLGTIIQSIFCAQSGASIRLTVWKWSDESPYPGTFPHMLENFRHIYSPGPTDGPWVSEGDNR